MKRIQLIFIVVVLAALLVPGIGLIANGPAAPGANEVAASLPSLTERDGTPNAEYLSELADYVNDGFFLRQELITAWAGGLSLLGHSAEDDVVLGTDGWLYYAPEIEGWAGVDTLTEREIFAAAKNLSLMQEYVESLGAQFAFTIAPDKSALYPEHLPGYPQSDAPSNAERLAAAMEALGVNYVNLFEAFSAEPEPLYFEHDSHWNSHGAALAADVINAALGIDTDYFSGYEYRTEPHTGDLFEMLYPAGTDSETNDTPTQLSFSQGENIRPDSITIDTTSGAAGSLLMFRDSFGELLYPFMAENFASARFSRQAAYDLTKAEELSSEAVVIELVERNLSWLYEQYAAFPAPERESVALAGAASGEADIALDTAFDGWHRVSGTISGEVDVDSSVYIEYNGRCYECLLTADGYTACLPGEGGGEYSLFWRSGGETTRCDMGVNI